MLEPVAGGDTNGEACRGASCLNPLPGGKQTGRPVGGASRSNPLPGQVARGEPQIALASAARLGWRMLRLQPMVSHFFTRVPLAATRIWLHPVQRSLSTATTRVLTVSLSVPGHLCKTTSFGKHGTRQAHALHTNPRHHVIEDLEEHSSMVGSHVSALLFIVSQMKP